MVASGQAAGAPLAAVNHAPLAVWRQQAGGWSLCLAGAWHGNTPTWPEVPAGLCNSLRLQIDCSGLGDWDSGLAARLWDLRGRLQQQGVDLPLDGLPVGLREVLSLAGPPRAADLAAPGSADSAGAAASPGQVGQGVWPGPVALPAPAARRAPSEAVLTITFFGAVLLALGRCISGRAPLRAADVLRQLDETGPRSLPIVGLTCALVGLMLAYMGGAQLGRIGAQGFVADVVTVGMLRELGGLMTGVILAGRVGAAFAAQLATMQVGEEIDALRVLGVDPIAHLVLPRLLALLLMAPALILFGALAGIVAGWPAAVGAYGVTTAEYLHQCLRALSFTHLWIGLFKGMLYVALVALAGCRCGLLAGRSAQAVGEATTAAVVKALVWVVTAACATTVVFTSLGY